MAALRVNWEGHPKTTSYSVAQFLEISGWYLQTGVTPRSYLSASSGFKTIVFSETRAIRWESLIVRSCSVIRGRCEQSNWSYAVDPIGSDGEYGYQFLAFAENPSSSWIILIRRLSVVDYLFAICKVSLSCFPQLDGKSSLLILLL